MIETPESPIRRLHLALEEVGDALAQADLGRLLTAEPALSAVLHELSAAAPSTLGPDVRPLLESSREALQRCRRLGASLADFTSLTLDPAGVRSYSRGGTAPVTGRASSLEARG